MMIKDDNTISARLRESELYIKAGLYLAITFYFINFSDNGGQKADLQTS